MSRKDGFLKYIPTGDLKIIFATINGRRIMFGGEMI
jgi:hypothetical protein